jgi:glycosyltransferase involved in cell wall biosynthesis
MNTALVSIVMVVCNVERFLCEAIESILGQTFTDFEFVIVDYGSTDSTKEIVERYAARDPRIRLATIPHCGLGQARNAGCWLARGQFIAVMDADDVAWPERLEREVEFLQSHPDFGLVGATVQWIDTAGRPLYLGRVPTQDEQLRNALAIECSIWAPTVLMRKEAFVLAGGYRDAFAPAEDYDLWLRIIEHYKCANLPDVLLSYRIHPHQISLRKGKQQTLGILAAKNSAALRRAGQRDVFNLAPQITPELLAENGLGESVQERAWMENARKWIRHLVLAGEKTAALHTAMELSRVPWAHVEAWQISDLHLFVARLLWSKGEILRSVRWFLRAIVLRPKVLGRPIRPWLQRMGLLYGLN